jgi:hypothetical protein
MDIFTSNYSDLQNFYEAHVSKEEQSWKSFIEEFLAGG